VNIGVFTDSYLPRRSGVVRAVQAASRHLRGRGHRVYVFAPTYAGYADTDPDVYRFPSVTPPGYPDFPLAVPYARPLLPELRALGLEIVHTHSPFLLGGVGVWVARRFHLPVAFTYHTLYAEYAHYAPVLGRLSRPLVIAYTTAYCNRCDRVLVSVPAVAEIVRKYGVRTPVEVIPSVGIDLPLGPGMPPADVRRQFGIPPDAPLLVFVGRLAREKGLPLLLDAVAGLPATVWLLLVGDGPERARLEASARNLGIASRVVFAGAQEHARVIDALGAADLFVFPSLTETLGLGVLEAMAAGRAVVAVRAGAMPDIVRDGDTGRLVPPDPGAFRSAIQALLGDDRVRAAMGARAREVAAQYAQDRLTDRLIGIYEAMLEHHRMRAGHGA
jgi:1,2-diacylglycerol 3-alpha-glucosyltransferase